MVDLYFFLIYQLEVWRVDGQCLSKDQDDLSRSMNNVLFAVIKEYRRQSKFTLKKLESEIVDFYIKKKKMSGTDQSII